MRFYLLYLWRCT